MQRNAIQSAIRRIPFAMKWPYQPKFFYLNKTRNYSTQSWSRFLEITSRAAEYIPLDQLDLEKYQLISIFPSEDLDNLQSVLENHKHKDYILYTIILLYIKLSRYNDAFRVLQIMSMKHTTIKTFSLISFSHYVPLPKYHLRLIEMLQQHLSTNFDFQVLRLKLLGREVPLNEILKLADKLFEMDLSETQQHHLYRLLAQIYGLEFGRDDLVREVIDEMTDKGFQIGLEYIILMKTYASIKDFEGVIRLFEDLRKQEQVTSQAVTLLMKAYCELGHLRKAKQVAADYAEFMTLQGWTTLIVGYCKSNLRNRMYKAEEMVLELLQKGVELDQSIYHAFLYGYSRKMVPRKFIEWYERMEKAGFQADRYTYGILQKMQSLYVYQPVTIVERDAVVQEWISAKLSQLSHLDGEKAQSGRILIAVRTGKLPSFEDLQTLLDEYPRLLKLPGFYANILSNMVKKRSPDIPTFVDYMKSKGLRFTSRIYSLLILKCKKRGIPKEGWDLFTSMIEDGVRPDEYTYRNLTALAIKTTDFKRLGIVLKSVLFERQIPITRSLYYDLVNMLAGRKKFSIPINTVAILRNIHPLGRPEEVEIWLNKYLRYDPVQKRYIEWSFKVLEAQYKEGFLPRWFQLSAVFSACLVSVEPIQHFPALIDMFKKMPEHDKENGLEQWKSMIIESNDWKVICQFLAFDGPESKDYELVLNYLKALGEKKDAESLYTACHYLKDTGYPTLLSLIIEQCGLYIRNEDITRKLWTIIPTSKWTEDILWTKFRCLIWWGCHVEAVDEATENLLQYPDLNGMVVREFQRWLRLKGLTDLEMKLKDFWSSRKPDWLLEDTVF